MIDQEFVEYIVSALVSKPDKVRVERVVDERGVLLTLHVDDEDLGRVIGRKGSTAQSLRVLLRALGSKNEAHYNLRIADDKDGEARPARPPRSKSDDRDSAPVASDANDANDADDAKDKNDANDKNDKDRDSFDNGGLVGEDSDFASDKQDSAAAEVEETADDGDSLLDKTRKELDDLNDLDI